MIWGEIVDGIIFHPCFRRATALCLLLPTALVLGAGISFGWSWGAIFGALIFFGGISLGVLFLGLRPIHSGERGLRVTMGVAGAEISEGLCWTFPFLSEVYKWDTREQTTHVKQFQVLAAKGIAVSVGGSVQWRRVAGRLQEYYNLATPEQALIDKIHASIQTFLGFCPNSADLVTGALKERLSAFVLADTRLRCEGRITEAAGSDWRDVTPRPHQGGEVAPWGMDIISFSLTGFSVPQSVQDAAQDTEVIRIRTTSAESFGDAQANLIRTLRDAGVSDDMAPLIAQQVMSPDTKQLPTPGPQIVIAPTGGGNLGIVSAAAAAAETAAIPSQAKVVDEDS